MRTFPQRCKVLLWLLTSDPIWLRKKKNIDQACIPENGTHIFKAPHPCKKLQFKHCTRIIATNRTGAESNYTYNEANEDY